MIAPETVFPLSQTSFCAWYSILTTPYKKNLAHVCSIGIDLVCTGHPHFSGVARSGDDVLTHTVIIIVPVTDITGAVLVLRTATPPSNPVHVLVALGRVLSKVDPYKCINLD